MLKNEADLLPLAQSGSIAVLARSPLAMGLLTGKLGPMWFFGEGDLRNRMPSFQRENLRQVANALQRSIAPIAADHGVSIATVALAWVLNQPAVSAVVVGASHPSQARANVEAVDLELETAEQDEIRHAFEGLNLDPYAGLGFAQHALVQGRRLAGVVGRCLAR